MPKYFFTFITFLLFSFHLQAQESTILKFQVSDSIIFSPLQEVEVLFTPEDEHQISIKKQSYLDEEILLPILSSGTLLIAHPFFDTLRQEVSFKKDTIDLGVLYLQPKMFLLNEIEIAYRPAIDQKGDTLIFAADSFMTNEFDDLIELFKNIPGIEIDADGTILVHGQKLEHILVDGEPFFGDNPEETARLLRSAMVDKIEVFDRKSEQDEFMDTDSGERYKTINIRLKDDAKKGILGKVNAGAALPEYWNNNLSLNAFQEKRKISVFGNMNNTANTDRSSGSSRRSSGGGGSGKPKSWSAGSHYSNKWLDDSLSLNGYFRYQKNISENNQFSETQYILPDTQYITIQNNQSKSIRHSISVGPTIDFIPTTTTALKLDITGSYNQGKSFSSRSSKTEDLEHRLINENNTEQNGDSESKSLGMRLSFRKKMKKKGRGFSSSLNGQWSENESNSLLKSDYNLIAIDSAYQLRQQKINQSERKSLDWRSIYTEPLHPKINLEVNYAAGVNYDQNDRRSYDQDMDEEDLQLGSFNPLYSSHYAYRRFEQGGGLRLTYSEDKFNFSIGSNAAYSQYLQKDLFRNENLSYSRFNLFPSANLRWKKSNFTNLYFNYNGSTQQPSMEQLQPLRDNEDPLNIAIGNPDLKQEFRHNLSLFFNNFNQEKESTLNLFAQLNFVHDAISQKQEMDQSGRRTYQFVNVSGNLNLNTHVNYSMKLQEHYRVQLRLSGMFSQNHNFINGLANENNNFRFSPNISIQYLNQKKADLKLNFSPIYQQNKSSVRQEILTDYWSFQQGLEGNITLPYHLRLGSSFDWQIRERLRPGEQKMNTIYWNIYLEKAIFKDRSLNVQLFLHDVLNQNTAYTRQLSAEQISENSGDVIKRYLMLSILWNFTKN